MGNCSIARGPEGHRHTHSAMQRRREVTQRQHNARAALGSTGGRHCCIPKEGGLQQRVDSNKHQAAHTRCGSHRLGLDVKSFSKKSARSLCFHLRHNP